MQVTKIKTDTDDLPLRLQEWSQRNLCALSVVLTLGLMISSPVDAAAPPGGQHAVGAAGTGATTFGTSCGTCHVAPTTANTTTVYGTNATYAAVNGGTGSRVQTYANYAGSGTLLGTNATSFMNATNGYAVYATTANTGTNAQDVAAYFATFQIPLLATPPSVSLTAASYAYSYQIVASATTADYLVDTTTYSGTGLPPGITVNLNSGLVSGTAVPTATPTTYTVTLSATQTTGQVGSATAYTIAVNGKQTIVLGAAPTVNVGTTGTVSVTSKGGSTSAVTFAASGGGCTVNASGVVTGTAAGTNNCTITANQAAQGLYDAAPAVSLTFSIGKGTQTFTLGTTPTVVVGAASTAIPVTALGASGLGVSFSTASAACSVTSGGVVTGITAGASNCVITATEAADANYNQATQNVTISVGPGTQTFTLGTTPTVVVGAASTAIPVTALGASGNPVTFSTISANCSVTSGGVVTGIAAGTNNCVITATEAANPNYNQATQNVTISVGPGTQTFTLGATPAVVVGSASTAIPVTALGASGNPVTFSTLSANCSVTTGGVVTGIAAGTNNCLITATEAASVNYNQATQTITISVGLTPQNITFTSPLPAVNYLGTGTILATGGPSGNPVTFTASGGCTVTLAGLITGTAAGTNNCTIIASQAANATYGAATATQLLSIGQATQSISFGTAPKVGVGTNTNSVTATATSGLAVTFSTTSTTCSVTSAGVVTGISVGTCNINASQAGNANYSAAIAATPLPLTIEQGNQTIAFVNIPAVAYLGTGSITATATPSGLPVTFSTASTDCSVTSAGLITGIAAGTNNCNIVASQSGNANYKAATSITQLISVAKVAQSITPGTAPTNLTVGTSGTLSATSSSALPVIFASGSPTICSVNGSTVTGLAVGTCTINLSQTGDVNFNAAIPATQSFIVGQGSQLITFGTTPAVYVGSTASINASSSSGLGITYSSLTPSVCTVSGATVTGVAAGTCTIAANQAGNTNYTAASQVNLTFTVTYLPPSVAPASMSTQLNTTSLPLDMTPYVTGLAVSGIGVSTQPLHGTASVSGMKVTYTPAKDYFGTDTFKVVAYNPGGPSANPATVTVTISGRPDPLKDARVTGLINAEDASIKRFGMVQVFNFQQRLESRHHAVYGPSNMGMPTQSGGTPAASDGTPGPAGGASSAGQQGRGYFNSWQPGTVLAYENDPNVLLHSAQLGGSAQAAVSDPMYGVLMNAMAGVLTTSTLNLGTVSTVANSAMPNDEFGRIEVWAAGNLRFGTRSQSGMDSKFTTDGISVGADKRIGRKLTLGMGMGYARDKSDIGSDGTNSSATGTSVAGYASYIMDSGNFLDVLLGYGRVNFSTNRFVPAVADFAHSTRSGDQLFGSVAFGYEFRKESLLWSPYGRYDFSYDRLNAGTESGAGINALSYASQNLRSSHLAFGMRAQSVHQTDFGVVQPHARFEYQRGFETNGQTSVAYADMLDTQYIVAGTSQSSNALMLGFGNTLVLNDTMRLTLDYQRLRSRGLENYQSVSLRFTKTIKGKNDLASLLEEGYDASIGKTTGMTAIGSFAYDDNVSRASEKTDKRSDTIYGLTVSKMLAFLPTKFTRLTVSGFLDVEKFRNYAGLDRVSVGAQGEYAYRFSGDFGSPTIGLFARYTSDAYESVLRDGARRSVGVNLRKSLTDRINLFAALADNVRTGKSDVFNTRDKSGRLNLDYALATGQTLYLTGEYRTGDIVSSGQPSLSILDSSIVFVRDDVFTSPWFYDYRMKGKTALFTLGYNFALGNRDSLDFAWRHAKSSPDKVPSFGGSAQYIDNLFSVSYLMAF